MSGYIWYSFASDETGAKLAKALGFSSGKKAPNPREWEVILGWGCKPSEKYDSATIQARTQAGELRVLNSPGAIDENRNKLALLDRLRACKLPVPGFISSKGRTPAQFRQDTLTALEQGVLSFPLVLQQATHKGEPTFFNTSEELTAPLAGAMKEEAIYYIRSLCPGREYRIHVLRDTAILAQTKSLPKDPQAALVDSLLEEVNGAAAKKKMALTPHAAAVRFAIEHLAPELMKGPNQLMRSTGRGWVLEDCALQNVPENVVVTAIEALEASGLDLGAVSITADLERARVTNITSAPALSDAHIANYVAAIRSFCSSKPAARKAAGKAAGDPNDMAPAELLALLTRKLRDLSKGQAEELLKGLGANIRE